MRNKEAVKKLLGLLKDYRKIIALIIACLLISTGLNMCIPLLNRGIMDYGFIGGDKELLIKQVICSLLIYMIIAVIDIIKEKKRVDISANIQYSLSEQSFQHLMRIKANYFSSKNYAEILNNNQLVHIETKAYSYPHNLPSSISGHRSPIVFPLPDILANVVRY